MARLRALPGVESVSIAENRPGSGWSNNNAAIVDGTVPPHAGNTRFAPARANVVGPDFFHVMGIPVLMGRDITEADTETSQKVAIINQTFAERYLANQNPIGHHLGETGHGATIVGVVGNSKYTGLDEKEMPMFWTTYTRVRRQRCVTDARGVARGRQSNLYFARGCQGGARHRSQSSARPAHHAEAQFEESISNQRLFSRLGVFFGLLAALLVATGLYGTLAYRLSHRTVEIGVRLAVGAQPGTGAVDGLAREPDTGGHWSWLGNSRWPFLLRGYFGQCCSGWDRMILLTFVGALAAVVLVAVVASLLPARRAAGIDPMRALRAE